jgi:hypothetical protein
LELATCSNHKNCQALASYSCGAEVVALAVSVAVSYTHGELLSLVLAQMWSISHVFVRVVFGSFSPTNSVPLHIGFVTHRVGELMMLMLGESVLSLVVTRMPPPPVSSLFRISLVAGFLISACCMWLQYSSSTFHAERHVLRHSSRGGVIWMNVVWAHAFTLVVVGVALRVMLQVGDDAPKDRDKWLLCGSLAMNFFLSQINEFLHTLGGGGGGKSTGSGPPPPSRWFVLLLEMLSIVALLLFPSYLPEQCCGYTFLLWCGGAVGMQALLELWDPNAHAMDGRFHHQKKKNADHTADGGSGDNVSTEREKTK